MPLIQKRKRLNDFRVGIRKDYTGTSPVDAALNMISTAVTQTFMGIENGYMIKDQEYIYVYHIEKHRARWQHQGRLRQYGRVEGGKMGNRGQTVSKKVKDRHWRIRLFRFPIKDVVSIKQHARHFEVELR